MKLKAFLEEAKGKKIMVVGDLMIDHYLWGRVERISPEAPVPVVLAGEEESRLGGAANVALNLQSLGANVSLAGLVGQDEMGQTLTSLMIRQGFHTDSLLSLANRPTTVKTRIIGNHQQMLRVDRESTHIPPNAETALWVDELLDQLPQQNALILQDYDKGCMSATIIQRLIGAAADHGVPVLVDPKREHFHHYPGCTVFKPNLRELNEGLGLHIHKNELDVLQSQVRRFRESMPHAHTYVTLGDNGMAYIAPDGELHHVAGHPRQVADVSGAGDTVISVLGLGFAIGADPLQTAAIANLAGGLVCEEIGVVPIRPARLLGENA